jgi:hypothetical protein
MKKSTKWNEKRKKKFELNKKIYADAFFALFYIAFVSLIILYSTFIYDISVNGIKNKVEVISFEGYGTRSSKIYLTKRENDNPLIRITTHERLSIGDEIYIYILPKDQNYGYMSGYLNSASSNVFDMILLSYGGYPGLIFILTVGLYIIFVLPIQYVKSIR